MNIRARAQVISLQTTSTLLEIVFFRFCYIVHSVLFIHLTFEIKLPLP